MTTEQPSIESGPDSPDEQIAGQITDQAPELPADQLEGATQTTDSYSMPDEPEEEPEPVIEIPRFDLMNESIPSFASLQQARATVFQSH